MLFPSVSSVERATILAPNSINIIAKSRRSYLKIIKKLHHNNLFLIVFYILTYCSIPRTHVLMECLSLQTTRTMCSGMQLRAL